LYPMLPDARSGKISTFARPARVDAGQQGRAREVPEAAGMAAAGHRR
jgi:hypothetical protein